MPRKSIAGKIIGFHAEPGKSCVCVCEITEYPLVLCAIVSCWNVHVSRNVARCYSCDVTRLELAVVGTSCGIVISDVSKYRYFIVRVNKTYGDDCFPCPMELEFRDIAAIPVVNDNICCGTGAKFCVVYPREEEITTALLYFILGVQNLNMHLKCITQLVLT